MPWCSCCRPIPIRSINVFNHKIIASHDVGEGVNSVSNRCIAIDRLTTNRCSKFTLLQNAVTGCATVRAVINAGIEQIDSPSNDWCIVPANAIASKVVILLAGNIAGWLVVSKVVTRYLGFKIFAGRIEDIATRPQGL